jgi:PPIC-type peptidyl-prolyl cis-trans isomerase-like protein
MRRSGISALGISLLLFACRAEQDAQVENAARRAQASVAPTNLLESGPYAAGAWRNSTQGELEQTVLWVSHILIRHYELRTAGVSFAPPDWRVSVSLPQRDRATARAEADALSEQLRRQPADFAERARLLSEDLSTRDRGGLIGGIPAYQLSKFKQVLDALSAIQPDEVSLPVESPFGFHIFRREAPPPEELVSGLHVVIGYDDARWLHNVLARGNVPRRTREEALALATNLAAQARAEPDAFPALVQQHSEHRDAAFGGDMGTWSTREPTTYPREVAVLRSIDVGEVAPPLDSLVGFQVILRVPNPPRKEYAMETLALLYDRAVPDPHPQSRSSTLATARSLAQTVAQDPASFDGLLTQYCCKGIIRWREGPEFPEVGPALDALSFGAVTPSPVESPPQFLVARRIDASALPEPTVRFELPRE